MELHFVDEQIDRDRVVYGNSYHGLVGKHLDVLFLNGDIQILRLFEDNFANFFFRVAIYYAEARLLLHFVLKLIFGNVGRKKFDGGKDAKNDDSGERDSFEAAFAALRACAKLFNFVDHRKTPPSRRVAGAITQEWLAKWLPKKGECCVFLR